MLTKILQVLTKILQALPFAVTAFVVSFFSWSYSVWLHPNVLARASEGLTSQEGLNLVLWVLIAISATVYSAIKFVQSQIAAGERMLIDYYGLGIFVVLAFVGSLCYFIWDDTKKAPLATLAGAVLATLGWITSAMLAVRNHQLASKAGANATRKQHTLNILLQMRQNPEFIRHRQNIYSKYPEGKKLTAADIDAISKEFAEEYDYNPTMSPRISESLRYITNYYEFLCAALHEGDLDETLLKKSLYQIMTKYEEKIRPFISYAQSKDQYAFEFFVGIVEKWRREPIPRLQVSLSITPTR